MQAKQAIFEEIDAGVQATQTHFNDIETKTRYWITLATAVSAAVFAHAQSSELSETLPLLFPVLCSIVLFCFGLCASTFHDGIAAPAHKRGVEDLMYFASEDKYEKFLDAKISARFSAFDLNHTALKAKSDFLSRGILVFGLAAPLTLLFSVFAGVLFDGPTGEYGGRLLTWLFTIFVTIFFGAFGHKLSLRLTTWPIRS